MVVSILPVAVDPSGATRSQKGRHMQALTQPRLLGVERDAPSVRCLKPGHLAPVPQETAA